MNFSKILVILSIAIAYASSSNPTYWIRKSGDRNVTSTTPSPKPVHDPSTSEADAILQCNQNRIWECALYSDLTTSQAFCKRLATNQPNESEKDHTGPNKFAAFRNLWVDMTGTDVYKAPTNCYRPTEAEKQQVENCFFSRYWRNKDANLTSHVTFCRNLASEKPNGTDISLETMLAVRKVWAQMPEVGQKDFAQITECSLLKNYYDAFPELLSYNCFQYYEMLKKPKTLRDIRRKEMHDCIDPSSLPGDLKHVCMCRLHTYRQLYYADK